ALLISSTPFGRLPANILLALTARCGYPPAARLSPETLTQARSRLLAQTISSERCRESTQNTCRIDCWRLAACHEHVQHAPNVVPPSSDHAACGVTSAISL